MRTLAGSWSAPSTGRQTVKERFYWSWGQAITRLICPQLAAAPQAVVPASAVGQSSRATSYR
jgi:hypothetical protein